MSLLNTAIGIFTVANPIGNMPIYLSFTDGDQKTDKAIARKSAYHLPNRTSLGYMARK